MDKTLECVGELTEEDICGPILNAEGDTAHTQQESEDVEDKSGTDPVPIIKEKHCKQCVLSGSIWRSVRLKCINFMSLKGNFYI